MRQDLKIKKSQLSLLDVKLGTILEVLSTSGKKSRFILIGMSLTGYALVSIYDDVDLCNFLSASATINALPVTLIADNVSINAYADCSRVTIIRFGVISNILKEKPGSYIGRLNDTDTGMIIDQAKAASTIAQNIKSDYFI